MRVEKKVEKKALGFWRFWLWWQGSNQWGLQDYVYARRKARSTGQSMARVPPAGVGRPTVVGDASSERAKGVVN